MPQLRSFMIGIIAGMRTMTAPCAVSWASAAGRLDGRRRSAVAPLLTALALGEYVADTLPMTGSRTGAAQFGARLVSGGLCGMALQPHGHRQVDGLLAGLCGAALGTVGGAAARASAARALGRDLPAALIEDVVAISTAALVVLSIPRAPESISGAKTRK